MDLADIRIAVLQGSSDAAGREARAREIAEETHSSEIRRLALIVAGGQRAAGDLAMLIASVLEPSVAHAEERRRRPWVERLRVAWGILRG